MIDNFAIALTHFLLAVAVWRLMRRTDLDVDPPLADAGAAGGGPDRPVPRRAGPSPDPSGKQEGDGPRRFPTRRG